MIHGNYTGNTKTDKVSKEYFADYEGDADGLCLEDEACAGCCAESKAVSGKDC